MKIVPLKNKTIEYKSKKFHTDRTYKLKIFDMTEGITFSEILNSFGKADDEKLGELCIELVELGLDSVNTKSKAKLVWEWFVIQEISNKIIEINSKTIDNVKK